MKRLIIFSMIFLLCGMVSAQEANDSRNMLRVGLNGAFFSSGDVLGFGISTEYAFKVQDYLSVTPRIMMSLGNDGYYIGHDLYEYHQLSAFGTSLSARFTPFVKTFKRLKVDIGLLYQRFTKSWGVTNPDDVYNSYDGTNTHYYAANQFGFLGSINLNVVDTENIESGFRIELLTSLSEGYFSNEGIQTGIYLGLKF